MRENTLLSNLENFELSLIRSCQNKRKYMEAIGDCFSKHKCNKICRNQNHAILVHEVLFVSPWCGSVGGLCSDRTKGKASNTWSSAGMTRKEIKSYLLHLKSFSRRGADSSNPSFSFCWGLLLPSPLLSPTNCCKNSYQWRWMGVFSVLNSLNMKIFLLLSFS